MSIILSCYSQQETETIRPMAFLTELATNATAQGVHVIIYSGNDDSLVSHFGSEGEYSLNSLAWNASESVSPQLLSR